jgi:hypothetical protein
VFNKGKNLGMFVRLLFLAVLLSGTTMNSTFVDSPLNKEGIEQAVGGRYVERPASRPFHPEFSQSLKDIFAA